MDKQINNTINNDPQTMKNVIQYGPNVPGITTYPDRPPVITTMPIESTNKDAEKFAQSRQRGPQTYKQNLSQQKGGRKKPSKKPSKKSSKKSSKKVKV